MNGDFQLSLFLSMVTRAKKKNMEGLQWVVSPARVSDLNRVMSSVGGRAITVSSAYIMGLPVVVADACDYAIRLETARGDWSLCYMPDGAFEERLFGEIVEER